MKTKLLIALSLLAPFSCFAEVNPRVLSTKQLVESCKLMAQPDHKAFCVGYFSATYDTYLVTRHPEMSKPFICPSQPVPKRDDLISDFVGWSEAHKAYDNEPAADNVLRFLAGRYPCAKR